MFSGIYQGCRAEADAYLAKSEGKRGVLAALVRKFEALYSRLEPWFRPGWLGTNPMRSSVLLVPFAFAWTVRHPRSSWVLGKLGDVYRPPWNGPRLLVALALLPVVFYGIVFLLLFASLAVLGPFVSGIGGGMALVSGGLSVLKWAQNSGVKERNRW